VTGYADLIARLATVADSYAADRAGINAWYEQQCAAAYESLAQADAQLAAAGAALATARGAVEFTDAEAVRLWGLLAARMKVPVPALGVPPGEDAATDGEHPARLLEQVRELLDEARPVTVRRPVRRVLLILLVLALLAGVATAGILLGH